MEANILYLFEIQQYYATNVSTCQSRGLSGYAPTRSSQDDGPQYAY